MRAAATIILSLILAAVIVVGAALFYVYSGAYNVAATDEHVGAVTSGLDLVKERSIRRQAQDLSITVPTDSASMQRGFLAHEEMCAPCHGAPGQDRGWMGQGMNPQPPELARAAEDFNDSELFWTIRHGIKLAGMPALAPTHDDDEILEIVAFVRMLPDMTPEEYASWSRETAGTSDGHEGHEH